MHNWMLLDIFSTVAIIPVFYIYLFAPGYVFGWATNLLHFRQSSLSRRILLSLPLSIVISTVLTGIIGRYVSEPILQSCFCILAFVVLGHYLYVWKRTRKSCPIRRMKSEWIVFSLALLWAATVVFSLFDIVVGRRLYVSSALWDHAVRIAFLHSALRSGPPIRNPFSYLGYAPVARYYYYWYVLCSYPARLTHIGARYVLYGSSAWAGFSLAATIPLYLVDFCEIKSNIKRQSVIGICLLSVTGLDIIPTVYEFLRARTIYPDMEWWDPIQVTSWQDALIWVPHHVAALVACFIGFLALWSVRRERSISSLSSRIVASIFAGLAFAASAGLSVYVTFTFALCLIAWTLRLIYKRYFKDAALYVGSAGIAVLVSLPYLHDLLSSVGGASKHAASGGGFVAFGPRLLPGFLSAPYFLKIRGFVHPSLFFPIGLVVVYILEFGFFAVIFWERFRKDIRNRKYLTESEVASWYFVAITLFVITFMKSSVIANNDLAYRSAMIIQFVLLLWGAQYLDTWYFPPTVARTPHSHIRNAVIVSTLLLGFVGTCYSLAILRTYAILDDSNMIAHPAAWLPQPPELGTDLFSTRSAFTQLNRILPQDSIVQYNPMTEDYLPLLEYDRFQAVDAFPNCGTEFGGDASLCPPVQKAISNLFNRPHKIDIAALCKKLSIDVLVARNTDPAWRDSSSWVWHDSPVVANSTIRAFRCR